MQDRFKDILLKHWNHPNVVAHHFANIVETEWRKRNESLFRRMTLGDHSFFLYCGYKPEKPGILE